MSVQFYLLIVIICFLAAIVFVCIFGRDIYNEHYSSQLKFDIGLDEMKESEEILKNFMSNNDIDINGNIVRNVAQKLDVEIGGYSNTIQNNAELSMKNGKKVVIMKEGLNDQEQWFCFAHECAHLIYGDPIPQARPEGKDKDKREQRADYLAAAMIMPREKVYAFLEGNNYMNISSNKKLKLIAQMSREYNVRDVVVMRRIKEVIALEQTAS